MSAGFVRYDPMREALELATEQRQLLPIRPSSRHMQKACPADETASGVGDEHSLLGLHGGVHAVRAQTVPGRPRNRTPRGEDDAMHGASRGECAPLWTLRKRSERLKLEDSRQQRQAERRTKKLLEERWKNNMEEPVAYGRRSTLRYEVRHRQGRWPPEARWAGFAPDKIPDTFERKGVLSTENGDGRLLPHERPDKWFYPGS